MSNPVIYNALMPALEKSNISQQAETVMDTMQHPSQWSGESREYVAIFLLKVPGAGSRLLSAEQYRHFICLIDTARSNLMLHESVLDEQKALVEYMIVR